MALEASAMAGNIIAALEAAGFKPTVEHTAGNKMWTAISEGIIKTIHDDGLVIVKGGGSYGGEDAKIE